MKSNSTHWDKIFSGTEESKLGWFEKDVSKTLELLNHIPALENAAAFLSGVGTSGLMEELLARKVKLVLNDISIEAINRAKSRLGNKAKEIKWLCQDIAEPIGETLPGIDIWIDRAVLHFLTDTDDIKGYFENVKAVLKVGGYAMFAEFSKTGAPKCAGLTLHRYSVEELTENLGPGFSLVSHFDYTYINPNGDPRPYIYALFKRKTQ
ncbi:MAG: class I SAM-dependent methyltransferase [bacterium]|nr:class I SAM-dependent methyltransferase [bacterium]